LTREIEQINARLKEIKLEKTKLETEIEHLEDSMAKEKGKITTANINIKNFTTRRLKSRKERNRIVREEDNLEQTEKVKKKQLDKAKKEFFESMKNQKDFTTEKYGPDYLQDLGNLLIENGNSHNKKKEEKKDESTK
jgi:DNA anti-recombination protein RmuC